MTEIAKALSTHSVLEHTPLVPEGVGGGNNEPCRS